MKNKRTIQRLFLTASVLITPTLLLLGILLSTNRLRNDWAAFVALCIRSGEEFASFVLHNGTTWLAALIFVFSLGLLKGLVFLVNQIRKVRCLRKKFQAKLLVNDSKLFANQSFSIVNDERLFAVTLGFIKPVTYISKAMFDRLSRDELRSVLIHEQYHLSHYHTLILLLANTSRVCLFFLPVIKNIVSYISLRLEFMADQAAIIATSRRHLAAALFKTLKDNEDRSFPLSVAAFSQVAGRVAVIIGKSKKPVLQLSKWLTLISLIALTGILLLFFKPQPGYAHLQINQAASSNLSINTIYCQRHPSQSPL